MNKFLAMVILKPDIKDKRMNSVQSSILNLFEQKTKVKKVWYLGKRKLDFNNKRYTEGIYIKLEVIAKSKKIEQIREEIRENQDILFSLIMNNDSEKDNIKTKIKIHKLPFYKKLPRTNTLSNEQGKKIYMLISKNIKLPFSESDIIAVSRDENTLLQYANKKIQDYIYVKGFCTLKFYRTINDIEKELKRCKKVQFSIKDNSNVGQELIIQEKYLI